MVAHELAEPPAWIKTLYFDSRAISTDEVRTVALSIFSFHSPSSESKSSSYSSQHGKDKIRPLICLSKKIYSALATHFNKITRLHINIYMPIAQNVQK